MSPKSKKEYYRLRGDTGQKRRIMLCGAILGLLAFVPLSVRLYDLMVTNYDYYARLALRNQTRTTAITAERGVIYDRNMNILAASKTVETVYLDPHELKQSGAGCHIPGTGTDPGVGPGLDPGAGGGSEKEI